MSTDSGEFASLMQRLREGSEDAVRELLDRYGHHVIRAVRRRLSKSLRSQFDSQDFTQAVWASFFESRERLLDFDDPDRLIAFLITMASNKVTGDGNRRLTAQKRDVKRVLALDDLTASRQGNLVARGPTASEAAVGEEAYERICDGEPSRVQRIIRMRGDGARFVDIAAELGVDERTVRRVFDRLKQRY